MTPETPGRVSIRTLGCKVNRTESESLASGLLAAGVELGDEAEADIVVVNTCTVTAEADAKARKAIRRALASSREPVVVATGCMAALDTGALAALGERLVVAPDKDRLLDAVLAALAGRRAEVGGASPARAGFGRGPLAASRLPRPAGLAFDAPASPPAVRTFNTRVMVKVQDGCDDRCAYCIVPDARGAPRSAAFGDVVARVDSLARAGTAEVVLTGVNIGRYLDGGRDLAALVEAIAETGVRRVRISSIEPLDLSTRLLETLAETPAVVMHLHVPLQSGSDATLAAMGRPYDTAAYATVLAEARRTLPGLAVTTDVICGLPGETDADFADSLAFAESCGFSRLHVFRYSRRPGTPAASMPGQVDPPAKAERASRMRDLGARMAAEYAAHRVGETADVLLESVDASAAVGTSEDYLRVRVPAGCGAVGDLVHVRLVAVAGTDLIGEPTC